MRNWESLTWYIYKYTEGARKIHCACMYLFDESLTIAGIKLFTLWIWEIKFSYEYAE